MTSLSRGEAYGVLELPIGTLHILCASCGAIIFMLGRKAWQENANLLYGTKLSIKIRCQQVLVND